MSEQRDNRYAAWWLPLFYFLLLLAGFGVASGVLRSEIRDLQRRVGELEQRSK